MTALNAAVDFGHGSDAAPYQQRWFPGVHGSVGGGGDVRGLSDAALDWLLSGARFAGLGVDATPGSPLFALAPDPHAPLRNLTGRKGFDVLDLLMKLMPVRARVPGPDRLGDVAPSAVERWRADPAQLPEGGPYRPKPLRAIASQLDDGVAPPASAVLEPGPTLAPTAVAGRHYTVRRGDELRSIALHVYRDADGAGTIFEANRAILDDSDLIYFGQVLFVPARGGAGRRSDRRCLPHWRRPEGASNPRRPGLPGKGMIAAVSVRDAFARLSAWSCSVSAWTWLDEFPVGPPHVDLRLGSLSRSALHAPRARPRSSRRIPA